MTQQPKALQLADELDIHAKYAMNGEAFNAAVLAAAELRRQHAEIERLRNDLAVYRGMVASVIVTAPAAADNLIEAYEKGLRDGAARRKPLTDEKIDDIWNRHCDEMGEASINDAYDIARAIEAAHGITGEKT
jgi:hypothetical protein